MANSKIGTIQISKSKLLIVEGEDEKRFLNSYLEYLSISDIQVCPIGGKTRLRENLELLVKDSNYISQHVSDIGIIRDADNDCDSAFQSVCDALKNAGLSIPNEPLHIVNGNPSVTVMVMPPNSQTGALENLVLNSVSSDPTMSCLDSYFSCLEPIVNFSNSQLSKAKVHAFLASREKPDLHLGEAAEANFWPFDNLAFEPLKNYILSL